MATAPRHRLWTALAVTAAAAGPLTGCTGWADPAEPAVHARALTAPELRTVRHGEDVLVGRCMRDHGFGYTPVPPPPVEGPAGPGYLATDPAWARRHGYGEDRQRAVLAARAADPNRRYLAGLTAPRRQEYLATLNGARGRRVSVRLATGHRVSASTQGCLATAQRELYGAQRRWFAVKVVAGNLRSLVEQRVLADRRYRAALPAWSSCVEHATGQHHLDPAALRRTAAGHHAPTAGAHGTAVVEADCARSSGLAATAAALESTHTAAVNREHAAQLRDRDALRLTALAKARRLVATG